MFQEDKMHQHIEWEEFLDFLEDDFGFFIKEKKQLSNFEYVINVEFFNGMKTNLRACFEYETLMNCWVLKLYSAESGKCLSAQAFPGFYYQGKGGGIA